MPAVRINSKQAYIKQSGQVKTLTTAESTAAAVSGSAVILPNNTLRISFFGSAANDSLKATLPYAIKVLTLETIAKSSVADGYINIKKASAHIASAKAEVVSALDQASLLDQDPAVRTIQKDADIIVVAGSTAVSCVAIVGFAPLYD